MIDTADRFSWLSEWEEIIQTNHDCQLYALVDMAASPAIMARLRQDNKRKSLCLFGYPLAIGASSG